MSCPCGSPICDCRLECLCSPDQCQCNICSFLPKICSRCNLPFYIIVHQRETASNICSCKAKNIFPSESHPLSLNSAVYNENVRSSINKIECPRCSLPIIIVTKSEDYHTLDSCCCSHKNSNITGTPPTEHETSNCTSDHRDISEDRQARKMSRRTRAEKSNWQYKKNKGKHLTNSEDNTDTETLTSEEFLVEDSKKRVEVNPKLRTPCTGNVTRNSNLHNSNFESNTQSPTGFFSRTGDNSMGNESLFANTSRLSSPLTSKDSIFPPESLGLPQLISQNVRPKLPHPFPTLPKPMPGLPAFRNCGGRDSAQQMKSCSAHPPLVDQPALAPEEKMEKWFETLQNVLTTSGELPDAETAAVIDKEDKEKTEQQPKDHSDNRFENKSAEKCSYQEPLRSSNSCNVSYRKSPTNNQKNGKEIDVIDPTTDTERSSSLSKSHKESESD